MNYKMELASLCAFDVKEDKLIKAFIQLDSSKQRKKTNAYADICRILFTADKTLSQYIHDMMIYSTSELLVECARKSTDCRRNAVIHDADVLSRLAGVSARHIKSEINSDFINIMPEYENGSFDYDADYFIEYVRKNGCGVYAKYKAFTYTNHKLVPITSIDPIRLSDLKKYEVQRNQVVENTVCFLNGQPANNALLYGDRGTGKSSTIKAILNEFDQLRMVEISKSELANLLELFALLKDIPLNFIVTIDDLTFSETDDSFGVFKAALEGSLSARPSNILIYATTNRRKIVKETTAEREGLDVNRADAIDESMSLADRFGLFVTFGKPSREVYLDIILQLAKDRKLAISEAELSAGAERFALKRGGRSPRIAKQYVDYVQSRLALNMPL